MDQGNTFISFPSGCYMDSMQKASTFPSHLKSFFFQDQEKNEIINPYYYYPVWSKWLILHNLVFVLNILQRAGFNRHNHFQV